MKNKQQFILAFLLVALAAISRLVPHVANFTPITALALFSGTVFSGNWKVIIPFSAILLSDMGLQLQNGTGFHAGTWMVYFAFAVSIFIGTRIKHIKPLMILAGAITASLAFFLITNFALFYPETAEPNGFGYPHTLSGVLASYTAALPFFRNSLAGDLIFSALFFGVYALASKVLFKSIHRV